LTAAAVAGLISAGAAYLQRANPRAGQTGARIVAASVIGVYLASLALGAGAATQRRDAALATDLLITSRTNAFSSSELMVDAGQVTVRLSNQDLFWHTFTIDSLGVDIKVPVGAEGAATFAAEPGTYEFYCAIPGHAAIGMKGSLTVR
jgi:plastocyanin